jgi:uncharacterized protein (DUF58 family)
MRGYLDSHTTLDSRQFTIAVKKLANSLSYGTDRSPFLGSGVEYVQSRQYQYGDPIRAIDWRITARTGKPYIKEFETPKRLPCYLLIDTSASMMVSSTKRTKYEIALHIAGGIGLACLERVSPVGVLGTGDTDLHIRPTLGRDKVLQWLLRLRRFRFDERTTLSARISQLFPSLLNRTLVIVISDLYDPNAVASIRQLNESHECVVLQMRDPLEEGMRGGGILRAVEAETGREIVGRSRDIHSDQQQIEQEFKRGGVDHLVLQTDRKIASPLRHFFESRGVFRRGAR